MLRDPASLPYAGCMIFDEANLDALLATGRLSKVILHEMAHVIRLRHHLDDKDLLVRRLPVLHRRSFIGQSSQQAFIGPCPGAVFTEPDRAGRG